ncbi:MerR family transcriptional regulator [Ochrobactrum sp. CM-21-5]|nr:MerR family transcriptional regulator [Ochrobactrum sp. CM-21-5]MBC2884320.1 MerR family transcriptional regulator [Ochrobactrum sp. CM-21-5]
MNNWTLRDITAEAAAAACRMPAETLATWTHRYKAPSGKRRGSRLYSLQDLTILQTARRLLSPGILAKTALDIAAPLLDDPPGYDATLFVTDDTAFISSRDDFPECNFTAINVGWVAHDLSKRLEAANGQTA